MIEGYDKKDFSDGYFASCPEVSLEEVVSDGVPTRNFASTTNFPTYLKHNGNWYLAQDARMDCCIVYDLVKDVFVCLEMRKIKKGSLIVVNKTLDRKEDGSEGVYVDNDPFQRDRINVDGSKFKFMSSDVSREKEINYVEIADKIYEQRLRGGYQVWVLGPAMVHTNSIDDMSWLIDNGYVNVLFGGNAVGVHDIENAIFGTSLGESKGGKTSKGDHSSHLRAIQIVREYGSINNIVSSGIINSGIMYNCVKNKVPFVLAGSIRDDGPLPETISDALVAQDVMREHTKKATCSVMIATALHSIATGNMLPLFYERDYLIYPLLTVCVDQSEFVVNKLKDRGTHQAYGAITNAQDFVHRIRLLLEKHD